MRNRILTMHGQVGHGWNPRSDLIFHDALIWAAVRSRGSEVQMCSDRKLPVGVLQLLPGYLSIGISHKPTLEVDRFTLDNSLVFRMGWLQHWGNCWLSMKSESCGASLQSTWCMEKFPPLRWALVCPVCQRPRRGRGWGDHTLAILYESSHSRRLNAYKNVAFSKFLMHFQPFKGIKFHKFSGGTCPWITLPCDCLHVRSPPPPPSHTHTHTHQNALRTPCLLDSEAQISER